MVLFALFILVPLAEIALFIQVGDAIGLWATLGLVVVTALIGAAALRSQGVATLRRLQALRAPDEASLVLLEGLLLLAAGLLLITPGVLTDTVGLALLVPPVRRLAARRIGRHAARIVFSNPEAGRPTDAGPDGPDAAPDGDDAARRPRGPAPFGRRRPGRRSAEDAVVLEDGAGAEATNRSGENGPAAR